MASEPNAGAVADGQPGDRLAGPGRYRPAAFVEAMRWEPGDPAALGAMIGWLMASGAEFYCPDGMGDKTTLDVWPSRGHKPASPGDWIVRGITGEFFPWPGETFAATYEPAAEPDALACAEAKLTAVEERARDWVSTSVPADGWEPTEMCVTMGTCGRAILAITGGGAARDATLHPLGGSSRKMGGDWARLVPGLQGRLASFGGADDSAFAWIDTRPETAAEASRG